MKKIKCFKIVAVYEDDTSSSDIFEIDEYFMSDIANAIDLREDSAIDALRYLAILGSKAITGINPVDHENSIKTHFGNTRNINSMIRGRFVPEIGKNMTMEDEMALFDN